MKINLENTEKIVDLRLPDGNVVPARVWQGRTESGIEIHAFITRVAVAEGQNEQVYAEFERDLRECHKARPDVAAIPLRLIL